MYDSMQATLTRLGKMLSIDRCRMSLVQEDLSPEPEELSVGQEKFCHQDLKSCHWDRRSLQRKAP